MKIEEGYREIAKKHNLPKFEELNREFDIASIRPDKCGLLLRAVMRMMAGRLSYLASISDAPLNPNPYSYHNITECTRLTKEDKEKIIAHYRMLCIWLHKAVLAELSGEKDIAGYINSLWNSWPKIKKEAREIAKKFTEAWEIDDKHKTA